MNRSRKLLVAPALALLLVLSACASTSGTAAGSYRDPYRELNRSLRGERAIVELVDGDVAYEVSRVRISEAETSWVENRRRQRVPTETVSRVIVLERHHPSPAGIALFVGLGLSLAFDDPTPLALALDFAIDSWIWGGEVPHERGHVVYWNDGSAY